MSKQIIKQPDGKYCIYSTQSDNFVVMDSDKQGLIDYFLLNDKNTWRKYVNEIIEKLETGEKPYHQFTMSYEDAVERIEGIYGMEFDKEEWLEEAEDVELVNNIKVRTKVYQNICEKCGEDYVDLLKESFECSFCDGELNGNDAELIDREVYISIRDIELNIFGTTLEVIYRDKSLFNIDRIHLKGYDVDKFYMKGNKDYEDVAKSRILSEYKDVFKKLI